MSTTKWPKTKVKPKSTIKSTVAITQPDVSHQLIDILTQGYDAIKIAVALAKTNPTLFVQLYTETHVVVEKWRRDVVTSIKDGNYILAIKQVREHTTFGLKEAKDIVDHLRNAMITLGYAGGGYTSSPPTLGEVQLSTYKALVSVATAMKTAR